MAKTKAATSRWVALLLAGAVVVTVLLYFKTLTGQKCSSLTSDYTQALAAGQPYLKFSPDPELLALPNPYDPTANQGSRALDAALYHGHYYLYFGVTPFVTLLVPWLLLTGRQLAESQAIAVYCLGVLLCLGVMLMDAAQRYFPRAGGIALALALFAGSLATAGLLLLRAAHIYELVIAAAWFHDTCALLAAYLALHDPKRRLTWLALAGFSAGLAVGARPNHLGVVAATAAFIFLEIRRSPDGRAVLLRRLAATLGPLLAVGLGLAWFNYIRFGSPLEFGFRYTLNDVANFSTNFAGLRHIPYNLWHYVLGVPQLTGWFPFFNGPGSSPIPVPDRYTHLTQLYGLLFTAPFVFCGLVLAGRRASLPVPLRTFVGLTLAFGLLNLAFLSIINGATYRYTADFLPHLGLAGCLGFLLLAENAHAGISRRLLYAGGQLLLVFSLVSSFCAACALFDLMQLKNPVEFARLARIFNQPRLWWEGSRGIPLYQFKVTAQLPKNRYGSSEPLLVTGPDGMQDFIYVYYTAPGYLQVGFEAIGRGGPVSDLIPVDYDQPVVFELGFGPEWPPAGARSYHGLTAAEVAALRRSLIVLVNGKTALDCRVDYHLTKNYYFWGHSPNDNAFGSAFSGKNFMVEKIPLNEALGLASVLPQENNPLRLEFSRAVTFGLSREPIVAVGYRHRGQLLSLIPEAGDRARFVISTTEQSAELVSPPFPLPAQTLHHLEFFSGSLLPPVESSLWGDKTPEERQSARRRVRLALDGVVIIEGLTESLELGPAAVKIGHNSIGFSNVAPDFSGHIKISPPGSRAVRNATTTPTASREGP